MTKNSYLAVLLFAAVSIITTSCGEIDGLAYNMNGEIQIAPKGLSGSDQYVTDIVAFYNDKVGDSGAVTSEKKDTALASDYYVIKVRSTTTKGGDAISAIKSADGSRQEWIDKLPADKWDASFLIKCAEYSGSNSSEVKWESARNFLTGTWTGNTTDGKEISFTITDERSDNSSSKWTNPCTMSYPDSTWTGTMTYVSSLKLVNNVPTDSITADISFTGDATTIAKIKMCVTASATSCAVTTLKVKNTAVVGETEIEKGVALTKKEE